MAPAHGSPRLFAVFHVLLRRLTPRHPPYALCSFYHVMRRNCISTLAAWFSSNQARYAVGKVLAAGECSAHGRERRCAFRLRCRHRALRPNCFSPSAWEPSTLSWPPFLLSCLVQRLRSGSTGKTARHFAGLFEKQPMRSVGVELFSSERGSKTQVLVYPVS